MQIHEWCRPRAELRDWEKQARNPGLTPLVSWEGPLSQSSGWSAFSEFLSVFAVSSVTISPGDKEKN